MKNLYLQGLKILHYDSFQKFSHCNYNGNHGRVIIII